MKSSVLFSLALVVVFTAGCLGGGDGSGDTAVAGNGEAGQERSVNTGMQEDASGSGQGSDAGNGFGAESKRETEEALHRETAGREVTHAEAEVKILEGLASASILEPDVVVREDIIRIAFDLPKGMDVEEASRYALGVASTVALPSHELIVGVTSIGGAKYYSAPALKVQQFYTGRITEEEFEESISITNG